MKRGGLGGGNTKTGLNYEGKVDLAIFLNKQKKYKVDGSNVFYNNKLVANIFKKYELYSFLNSKGINWKDHISSQLLPDNCIYVIINNNIYIIEVKTQHVSGSVDEKLQTCDFKKKQYKKLFSKLNVNVEFIYVLDKWFQNQKYKDTLDYIISVGCHYYFDYIPLTLLDLPVPE